MSPGADYGLVLAETASIVDAFRAAARSRPDDEALVMPGTRRTYADLLDRSAAVARAFVGAGIKPGRRVGLYLENSAEFVELILGAAAAGVVPVLFNTKTSAAELQDWISRLDVGILFTTRSTCAGPRARGAALSKLTRVCLLDADVSDRDFGYQAFLGKGDGAGDPDHRAGPDSAFAIVFTSGLTGPPKACLISHQNLLCKVEPFADRFRLDGESRVWFPMHMFQIGFVAPLIAVLSIGATAIAMDSYDARKAIELICGEDVTHAYAVYLRYWLPVIYDVSFRPSKAPMLTHACLIGPLKILRRAQRAAPQCTILNTYGGAETAGGFCMPDADDPALLRLESVGRPFEAHEIRIADPISGEVREVDEVGEIQIRGIGIPQPPQSEDFGSRFTLDGWLRSEDFGVLGEDGSLYYHGRMSEMLQVGGERVSAFAIEAAIGAHPAVAVIQVIGLPDEALGEAPVAFVERRPGSELSKEELLSYCREHLPAAFVPREVTFISEWPTSASKISKRELEGLMLAQKAPDGEGA